MSAAAAAGPAPAAAPVSPPIPQKADLSAWLAVIAGSLGALLATLDISIVNSSLPTIQGEIGATPSEGTWIATAYLVAEIIIIPLSAWLQRLLGLRTLLLGASVLFTGFSVVCGLSTTLMSMIVGRAGQGLTGGVLIPTALTIIATRLPPRQQAFGTALFGVTAILGPVVGPLIGGWLTINLSWHYAFFINVPLSVVLILLLMLGLPHQRANLDEVRNADWLGIAGLILGLGGLTIVLEEGQREQWFESALIWQLTGLTVFGFLLLFAGQMLARKPVIRLRLLADRQFGSVFVMALVTGMVLYGTAFVIPQFLAAIADYDALQAGQVLLLSGLPSIVLMAFTPLLIRRIDVRVAVSFGLLIMALSCWVDRGLTIESVGSDFTESQLLRGVGQIFVMLFLNQAAIRSVPPEQAADASGLYNAARNLGGSIGLALLGTVQEQRTWLHARRLEEALSANSLTIQDYVRSLGQSTGSFDGAMLSLAGQIQQQALVMTYGDLFFMLAVGILCVLPLVLFLRPLAQGDVAPMH